MLLDIKAVQFEYSGPCDERPPLLRSQDGLSWGCGLISGCIIYSKYHLGRTRGGHIRQVDLILGDLSSKGLLYIFTIMLYSVIEICLISCFSLRNIQF